MTYSFISFQTAGGGATLTLDRPPLNVINTAMLEEMDDAIERASFDSTLTLLVVNATGKLFSAGVDVAEHTADRVNEMLPLFHRVCCALGRFRGPTLAAVHGHALGGGCEIALCCDLVIASTAANFAQPEIKLASFPPVAVLRLPALAGYRRAAEMLFTGNTISAEEAARSGIINRAVPPAEFQAQVDKTVQSFRSQSAVALRISKRALLSAWDNWDDLKVLERIYLKELMSTEDAREGLEAFTQKRFPVWRNK